MLLERLRLRWQPGTRVEVWAKHDHDSRTIAFGTDLHIDHIPVEDAEHIHGAFATGLGLPCRPRSYDEMVLGHTRAALKLLDPDADPGLEVWVLAIDDPERGEMAVSAHRSEPAAINALRELYTIGDEIADEAVEDHVSMRGIEVKIDGHVLLGVTHPAGSDLPEDVRARMIREARGLLDQSPGHVEYVRALVELTCRTLGLSDDDKAQIRDEIMRDL